MSRVAWEDATDALGRPSELGRVAGSITTFRVERHGAGRSHWDAVLSHRTETFPRKSEAKTYCEQWAFLAATRGTGPADELAGSLDAGWDAGPGEESGEPDFQLDEPEYDDEWGDDVDDESGEPDASPATGQESLTDPAAALSSESTDDEIRAALSALARLLDGTTPAPRGAGYYNSSGQKQDAALKAARGLARLRRVVEEAVIEQVSAARVNTQGDWNSNAATWDQIGAALGVSKQSASTRYGVKKT